mgnify:CR=1 FL=1
MANDKIEQLRAEILGACTAAADMAALEAVRVGALGKKGSVTGLMKDLSALPPEDRKAFGQRVNTLRDEVTAALDAKKAALGDAERALQEKVDTLQQQLATQQSTLLQEQQPQPRMQRARIRSNLESHHRTRKPGGRLFKDSA